MTSKPNKVDPKEVLKKKLTPTNKLIDKPAYDMTCRKCGYMVYMSIMTNDQIMCDHDFPLMDELEPDMRPDITLSLGPKKNNETNN